MAKPQPAPKSNPTSPTAALFPNQSRPLGVYKGPATVTPSMTSTKPVASPTDRGPLQSFGALSDPGKALGYDPNKSLIRPEDPLRARGFKDDAMTALQDTKQAALEMGSAGLAPGYEAAEKLATELTGEEGFGGQKMMLDQSRRNEELAIVVGAMVKSGHMPVQQAIALMESLPKNSASEDFSLKSAFALGAQMAMSAVPIASFVQSLVSTSAQAAAQRAAVKKSTDWALDEAGKPPMKDLTPDEIPRGVSPRNPDMADDLIADTTKQGGARFSVADVVDDQRGFTGIPGGGFKPSPAESRIATFLSNQTDDAASNAFDDLARGRTPDADGLKAIEKVWTAAESNPQWAGLNQREVGTLKRLIIKAGGLTDLTDDVAGAASKATPKLPKAKPRK